MSGGRRFDAAGQIERKVGRYEIVRELGRGGMAVVYVARQERLDRTVALKELLTAHAEDPAFVERFVRESRLSGSFNHPNIVTVFDYFEHEGTPYIAMEYLERGSLRPLVGKLSLAQIAGVLESLLAGLAQAEVRGVVHRDLKPENLLITSDGRIKIADFGIAKALWQRGSAVSLTATGVVMGTPSYMAPEQAMGKHIGPWTDLYATGVIAYELLVGRVPFGPPDPPMAILVKHVQEPIPPARELRPDLSPELAGWLDRMLAKDPAERPAGAEAAWDELEEIVLGVLGPRWRRSARLVEEGEAAAPVVSTAPEPVEEAPEATAPPAPAPTPTEPTFDWPETARWRPRRAAIGGLAALVAAAVAAGLFLALRSSGPTLVTVPALTGMREARAVRTISALGLRSDGHIRSVPQLATEKGRVFGQSPRRGARLRKGAFVTLVVSAGKPSVSVPDVRGDRLPAARRKLSRAHLGVSVTRVHDSQPAGTVLSQSPETGSAAAWGSGVRLRVSAGPPLVIVPPVVGLAYGTASARLAALGLGVRRVDTASSQGAGIVVDQRAAPGSRVVRGRTVTVYVSRGPVVTSSGGGGSTGHRGGGGGVTITPH